MVVVVNFCSVASHSFDLSYFLEAVLALGAEGHYN